MRRIAITAAVSTMTLSLGCGAMNATGGSSGASPVRGNDLTVGLLMPETTNTRYVNFDYPIIKRRVAELTKKQGRVKYANAGASASRQARQMQEMIDDKVDVILLDAVDSHAISGLVTKAKNAGIPVIAYDRLAEGPIDAYVSFDNEFVGEVQGRTLLAALGREAGSSAKIVMMNGSPTDPNAKQFKKGALAELRGKVTIAKSYDVRNWSPDLAQADMAKALNAIGVDNIAAIYSANDAMAGGIVKALKAAGVIRIPPLTGQDADLDAVQRIVTGKQYMTVYKPYPDEAEAAADMAVDKVQGKDIQFDALTQDRVDSPTNKGIPAQMVAVSALTQKNIRETVVADGIYKISDICIAKFMAACTAIGLD
ncbi:ABC transporter substrate-binding protein [Streptomyces sp. MUSC 125]|uniref:substrate-binding domain-containing protein n=1 Tax=Streptomyces sp. MUSC 125 TaxID=1428624 RepID=UPI00057FFC27|nr:substrate-binding domain-containing protein [Streptomyces sp. MUSC 125]KIE25361.1 ABC transporter substrate-binding protein [Streptomyces sp. MUSC 125]